MALLCAKGSVNDETFLTGDNTLVVAKQIYSRQNIALFWPKESSVAASEFMNCRIITVMAQEQLVLGVNGIRRLQL